MMKKLIKLFRDEEGATAVEYGLIVAAIAAVIIVVVVVLGQKMNNAYQKVNAHIGP
jgi:pilus assembly protein Flp/PilA